jgi:Ca2+-binding RTX toxin-like protein
MVRRSVLFAAAVAAIAVLLPSAGAQAANWTCRASAVSITVGSEKPVEPLAANKAKDPCQGAGAGVSNAQVAPITSKNAYARTQIDATKGSDEQAPKAEAGAAQTTIAQGNFSLNADVVTSSVKGSCLNGGPTYTGASQIEKLSINGTDIPSALPVFVAVGSLVTGQLVVVRFNEQEAASDSNDHTFTQTAVHISVVDLAGGSGANTLDVKLGQSQVGSVGNVCSPPPPCPQGQQYDGSLKRCVAVQPAGTAPCPPGTSTSQDGTCLRVIAPPSGTTVPLSSLAQGRIGACGATRFGLAVAIVGTRGSDRVTGTNGPDRMFLDAGDDFASGGRGNDCIRGEVGNDRLDGSNGSDWVFGDEGKDTVIGGAGDDLLRGGADRDRVIGGTGNDRLFGDDGRDFLQGGSGNNVMYGGRGNDFITAGSGRDRVFAGPGNDVVNAAKAGPATKINCGPGRDTVRVNGNEARKRSYRGCERIFVVKQVR